jgi:hypothetical protein
MAVIARLKVSCRCCGKGRASGGCPANLT